MSHGRFAGRVALVTGAGSPAGIAVATAQVLSRDGERLAIASTTDRIGERVAELAAAEIPASGHVGDLTASGMAERIVSEALAPHGRLDILLCNAGMTPLGQPEEWRPLLEVSEAEWDRLIALNSSSSRR